MGKFIRLPMIRVEGIGKPVWLTPVLIEVEGGYRMHHIDAGGVGFERTRFVPIEHLGKRRRKAVDVELENQALRELCEIAAIELRVNATDAATEQVFEAMRKMGIEVD